MKQRLRTELGEDVFNSWFGRAEFDHADKSAVSLSVPTRFLKSWIASHYAERLLTLWTEERPGTIQVEIIVRGAVRSRPAPRPEAGDEPEPAPVRPPQPRPPAPATTARAIPEAPEADFTGSPVDPRYTFESFCDGAANRVV
ncbi:MAG: chromosomal replication initiator protein DnaA, partial [Rhizobiales bacterium]|nr:chromosomal replication initiator protein DnaA [Hyphomicrobiales bacterium]